MATPTTTQIPSLIGLNSPFLTGCQALLPGLDASYGYQPSLAADITLSTLFFLSFCVHLFRTVQLCKWTSIILSVRALVELLGWATRTWGSKCPYNKTAFIMQVTTRIIGPVFITAAIYVILGELIQVRGTEYLLLRPRLYVIIFCACDAIALFVQATGATLAGCAFDNGTDTTPGSHTVAGGVIFQLATVAVFALLLVVFLMRSQSVSVTAY